MRRIVVTIASADPPEGYVVGNEDDAPSAFVGWLGLIRSLADAVAADSDFQGVPSDQGGSTKIAE
jgi:hypothetical protein